MAGYVVGKSLANGFPGGVSRSGDAVIRAFPAKGGIRFGMPVVINDDGTVSAFDAQNTAAQFAGFAVRAVKQAADESGEALWGDGEATDVILRGGVCVTVVSGTPVCGGAVYVQPADGSISAAPGDGLVLLENVVFSGAKDAGGVAEATILDRTI